MGHDDRALAELTMEREQRAMQALMDVAAVGLQEQADILAQESGLWFLWKAPVKAKRTDGTDF